MDNRPLQDFPAENEATGEQQTNRRSNSLTRWMESLAHLGLGEFAVRIGTNVLTVLVVVLVVWVMQAIYHEATVGWVPNVAAAGAPTPAGNASVPLPAAFALTLDGIQRQAIPHTTIPSRPRLDVVQYTVQPGDSVFVIADKFGLKPSTILFSNKSLENDVDLIKPGQKLNILPVDGAYYQWQGTETLTGVAKYYNTDAQSILDSPANHLDPDTVGSTDHPNIPGGTWLVIPGGYYVFYWNAPVASRSGTPSNARVTGAGYCGAVNGGPVGYGTFIFPTVEHWLSGTDYRPDVRHFGVDFAGSLGNAVYAVDAGVVVYAGWNDWGYGNLIILDHGNGWQSYYAHLSQINVSCGQGVGQGDVIGLVGTTGHSTGPHLHFELSYNSAPVNPHTIFDIPAR